MVSYIYYGLLTVVMKGGSLKEVDFLYQFWRYWFLQVLFLVVIIFYFISQKIHITSAKCQIIVGGICVILGLLFEYIIKWPDESPFYINVVPMAFFFYLLGFACRGFFTAQLKQICDSNGKKVMMLIIALCSLIVCALCNSSVTMYNNNYGLFPIFILGSLSGIVVVWVIADFMQKNMFLKWCGKNSIVIYVWQFVLTQFFKNVIEIIFNVTHVNSPDFIMTVCVFGVCVFAVIPIVIFSNRFVPELYGKKRVGCYCSYCSSQVPLVYTIDRCAKFGYIWQSGWSNMALFDSGGLCIYNSALSCGSYYSVDFAIPLCS